MKNSISKLKLLVPDPKKYQSNPEIRSFLSFYPFYKHLQIKVQNPNEQFLDFYLDIIRKLEETPELLRPLNIPDGIKKNDDLIQQITAIILPLSDDDDLKYFTLGTPYKFEFFCYSDSFADYFSPDDQGYITFPPERPFEQIQTEYMMMAYRLILRKFYNLEIKIQERKTNRWVDKTTGLHRYSRIHIDESFIDVIPQGELPTLSEGLLGEDFATFPDLSRLQRELPLSLFSFEGFIVRRSIGDFTVEECVTQVKNALIEMQSVNPQPGYRKLRLAVETLIGLKNVEVSLTPFLKLNQKFVFYNKYSGKSILLKGLPTKEEKEEAYSHIALLLERERRILLFSDLNESGSEQKPLLPASCFKYPTGRCYIIAPLFDNNELIGMLEAASPNAGALTNETLHKFDPVHSFFEIACRNYIAQYKNEIGALILEKFTALQPVVEWKFLEVAWKYLKDGETQSAGEIGVVSFDQVYPVYGAVDIKDSTSQRSHCYQKDLLDQLHLVDSTLRQLNNYRHRSDRELINQHLVKNKGFIEKIEWQLLPDDEEKINQFLELEIRPFFKELTLNKGDSPDPVSHYFESVDPGTGHLTKNRRDFEDSIEKINTTISRYLETEQDKIQGIYPHYFEKFRTDGLEYNIYMGESFAPDNKFNFSELKKIRLWQLRVMIGITRLTHNLASNITIPLQTTQLVLVYNKPICISFRRDERRFDVEGSESVAFEILKKRIDKVTIKKTGERLTKPGTIAIVYSHDHEIAEYDEYFNFLQKEKLLSGDKEMLELEDVQSISGLKAIRFKVTV